MDLKGLHPEWCHTTMADVEGRRHLGRDWSGPGHPEPTFQLSRWKKDFRNLYDGFIPDMVNDLRTRASRWSALGRGRPRRGLTSAPAEQQHPGLGAQVFGGPGRLERDGAALDGRAIDPGALAPIEPADVERGRGLRQIEPDAGRSAARC
jgi:hypothetical protein